jgi:hypothetical protein
VKISNKKKFFFASETNTFHILYVESKNLNGNQQHSKNDSVESTFLRRRINVNIVILYLSMTVTVNLTAFCIDFTFLVYFIFDLVWEFLHAFVIYFRIWQGILTCFLIFWWFFAVSNFLTLVYFMGKIIICPDGDSNARPFGLIFGIKTPNCILVFTAIRTLERRTIKC